MKKILLIIVLAVIVYFIGISISDAINNKNQLGATIPAVNTPIKQTSNTTAASQQSSNIVQSSLCPGCTLETLRAAQQTEFDIDMRIQSLRYMAVHHPAFYSRGSIEAALIRYRAAQEATRAAQLAYDLCVIGKAIANLCQAVLSR